MYFFKLNIHHRRVIMIHDLDVLLAALWTFELSRLFNFAVITFSEKLRIILFSNKLKIFFKIFLRTNYIFKSKTKLHFEC